MLILNNVHYENIGERIKKLFYKGRCVFGYHLGIPLGQTKTSFFLDFIDVFLLLIIKMRTKIFLKQIKNYDFHTSAKVNSRVKFSDL